jgi:hypothetical protein
MHQLYIFYVEIEIYAQRAGPALQLGSSALALSSQFRPIVENVLWLWLHLNSIAIQDPAQSEIELPHPA